MVKVKVTLQETTKAQRGGRGKSVLFLQNRRHPPPIYSLEWPGTHRTGGWVDPRSVWTGAVNLSPPGFDHRTVQPLKNCCTIYSIMFAIRLTLVAGLPARSQYPEGPATGHLDTGFFWFPCVYKRMLRWFPSFQVATTCFSCSPPDLNFLVTYLIFVCM